MELEDFNYFYENIHSRDDLFVLASKHPTVAYDTLLAIYSQKYQEETKKNFTRHKQYQNVAKYYARYASGESLLDIAEDINLAPCLLARLILQCYLEYLRSDASTEQPESKKDESEPDSVTMGDGLLEEYKRPMHKPNMASQITALIRNPDTIDDARLRYEIRSCVLSDDNYSPLVERIRHSIGLEMELKLFDKLTQLNLAFRTEHDLRQAGFHKTPDFYLSVPIQLVIDGCELVINWVESKASFGDLVTHDRYCQEQFRIYVQRYGPGLVIYWFGYILPIKHRDPGVLVLDHLPHYAITPTSTNSNSLLQSTRVEHVLAFIT